MPSLPAKHSLKIAVIAAATLLVGACTKYTDNTENDPWEPMNRGLYQIHYAIDGVVLRPVTQLYRAITPERGQAMVHNFVTNLGEPITFGNSVLQADPENSFTSLWRFMINSTFGVFGLFDAASEVGLKGRTTDFGQTLALYGVESGPYLFLPILGPSSARDGVGRIGDIFMYPPTYVNNDTVAIALWSVTAVDTRNKYWDTINDIYKTSIDPYATFRSGYMQKRANDIAKARAARDAAWKKAKAAK